MQRHEVGFGEQLIERNVGQPGLTLLGLLAARRPIEHAHGEAARAPRHCLADAAAAADQAERLARTHTAEVIRLGAGEAAFAHQPVAFHHAARNRQHQPEREIGGRLDDHGRDHGHGNPLAAARRRCCPA